MGTIKTSDISLAAALCVETGGKIAKIENDRDSETKKWFVIESKEHTTELLAELSTSYFNNELLVEVRSFSYKLKALKSMIYNIKK